MTPKRPAHPFRVAEACAIRDVFYPVCAAFQQ
jgi:hypothetical protein